MTKHLNTVPNPPSGLFHSLTLPEVLYVMCSSCSGRSAFQATALPVTPGIVNRTTVVPSVGNLQDLYPEKFGGVSDINISAEPICVCDGL